MSIRTEQATSFSLRSAIVGAPPVTAPAPVPPAPVAAPVANPGLQFKIGQSVAQPTTPVAQNQPHHVAAALAKITRVATEQKNAQPVATRPQPQQQNRVLAAGWVSGNANGGHQELLRMRAQIDSLNAKALVDGKKLAAAEARISQANKLLTERAELVAKLKRAESSMAANKETERALRAEIARVSAAKPENGFEEKLKLFQDKESDAQKKIAELEAQAAANLSDVENAFRSRIAELETAAAESTDTSALRARIAELETESTDTSALRARIAELETESTDTSALRARIAELETESTDTSALRARIAELEPVSTDTSALRARIAELQKEADEQYSALLRETSANKQLAQRLDDLGSDLVLAKQETLDLKTLLDAAHTSLKTDQTAANVQSKLDEFEAKERQLQSELRALRERNIALVANTTHYDSNGVSDYSLDLTERQLCERACAKTPSTERPLNKILGDAQVGVHRLGRESIEALHTSAPTEDPNVNSLIKAVSEDVLAAISSARTSWLEAKGMSNEEIRADFAKLRGD